MDNGTIEAAVTFHEPARKSGQVALRLPHPKGFKARRCAGGEYDPQMETATFAGTGKVTLKFAP